MAEDYRRWEKRVEGGAGPLLRTGGVLALCFLLAALLGWLWLRGPGEGVQTTGLTRFSSEAEFSDYLSRSEEWLGVYWGMGMGYPVRGGYLSTVRILEGKGEGASRVSGTTVQVRGIDEPDLVKTDGKYLYFSGFWDTKVIRAFPPSELSVVSTLRKNGEILLLENLLILLSFDGITGYDVSDPSSPGEIWNVELNSTLVSARLRGKIYLITCTTVNSRTPLPLSPLKVGGRELRVGATDIYRPPQLMPADSVYTALVLDPVEGRVEKSLSFIGYSGTSVVYMSEESLYLTYTYYPSPVRVYYDFLRERGWNLLRPEIMQRVERLMGYELSDTAKLVELNFILASTDLPQEELEGKWEEYLAERKRELETTHVVKIGLEAFEIVAQAEVPGRPLNQFSLEEEGGYLRLATTVEPWIFGGGGKSANDVYVLDRGLKVVGSLRDLGLGEEIYAVRFLGDKGYVVTFREIDPLYVIDLTDPYHPRVAGELKIPGYSSYLHPITENLLLGIGKESWKVKASLFDVSSPSSPVELDKLLLEEYWSEILETHHAFLLDPDHKVFFLPAFNAGYVVSYSENDLKVVREVKNLTARRAVYLDDYLYVLSEESLIVLDERTWETVNEIEL